MRFFFQFLEVKFSTYLHRRVLVMRRCILQCLIRVSTVPHPHLFRAINM